MLADIVPITLSDIKEFMQAFGWPGVMALFIWKCAWPAFNDHMKSLREFLDVARVRIVTTDESLKELRAGIAVVVRHAAPPDYHPDWIKSEKAV